MNRGVARVVVAGVVAALSVLLPATASATAVAPPTVTAAFAQPVAAPGAPVGLTFTVTNVDPTLALTGVAFSATLPPGLVVASPPQLATSCEGTVTAPAGGSAIALSGAALAPAASCVVRADVVAAGVGLYAVASDAPTSTQSGPGAPSNTATLRVLDVATSAPAEVALGAGTLADTAGVVGPVAPQTGATVAFALYGPDDAFCAGAPVFTSVVAYPPSGGPVTSGAFAPVAAGAYRWRATYSDSFQGPAIASPCNAPGETTLVGVALPPAFPPPPPPTGPQCLGRLATIVVSAASRGDVNGTAGPDVIVGTARGETIDGRGGADVICAGAGNDRVRGSGGDDVLVGGDGNDDVRGGIGNDRLGGGEGPDRVDGGPGADVLDEQNLGLGGHDRLFGGTGRDIVRTAGGLKDKINCGPGLDALTFDGYDRQVHCESRIVLPPPAVLPR